MRPITAPTCHRRESNLILHRNIGFNKSNNIILLFLVASLINCESNSNIVLDPLAPEATPTITPTPTLPTEPTPSPIITPTPTLPTEPTPSPMITPTPQPDLTTVWESKNWTWICDSFGKSCGTSPTNPDTHNSSFWGNNPSQTGNVGIFYGYPQDIIGHLSSGEKACLSLIGFVDGVGNSITSDENIGEVAFAFIDMENNPIGGIWEPQSLLLKTPFCTQPIKKEQTPSGLGITFYFNDYNASYLSLIISYPTLETTP